MVDILAIGVHPDDIELSCSGYLLKEIHAGRKVALLDLTQGELGTRGNVQIRRKEALEAAKKMGALSRECLNLGDGFFDNNKKAIEPIIVKIRKWRPSIILANAVEDRHPDHGRAAELVGRAAYLSGLRKIETRINGKKQEAWRPRAVYHYIQDYPLKPDLVVDITDFLDQKMELIHTFKSQFYDPSSLEPDTPISSADFLDFQVARARVYGKYLSVKFAEGFTVARPVGVSSLLPLK